MKLVLKKFLFIISLLVILISCDGKIPEIGKVITKTEEVLRELEIILEQKEEVVLEPMTIDSIPKFKDLTLVSWNIQHLGRSKTDEEIWQMAQILRHFDIVAIQEVVAKDPAGAQAVAKLADELNRTGANWDYQVSNPTISPSVYISERYAFLWKTSKVTLQHRAFLDSEREDLFFREPFIAKFKSKKQNKTFYIANYHSRKYTDKPQEEIIYLLDYPERWDTSYFLIAGDFNTPETDKVWNAFYEKGFASALKNKKTTLKQKCNSSMYLNHPIDNIYYTPKINLHQSNSIDFVQSCYNLDRARGISDHLPIFIEFSLN